MYAVARFFGKYVLSTICDDTKFPSIWKNVVLINLGFRSKNTSNEKIDPVWQISKIHSKIINFFFGIVLKYQIASTATVLYLFCWFSPSRYHYIVLLLYSIFIFDMEINNHTRHLKTLINDLAQLWTVIFYIIVLQWYIWLLVLHHESILFADFFVSDSIKINIWPIK